ncbi:putative GTPase activating protein for Arf-domain-containing protein [Cantharellus anzutake]|uniref:putative GTPase activating protein for Arf-domain-containing protein n=1 Tax=Cantharellus anzutake TaxID=1750568 RepID=UPI001906F715|nr:putative GTPase activating protein for Arf-domain-containing protein [Cantharellus anzutake]KAF8341389.1 putative GTPase activating protein for Arf-domain-containing protein [Cantharellus anzutake]
MDPATKRELAQLMAREDLNNHRCADCGERLPQWVSLSHAIWICLSCAGIHRGFGVHISFVRSAQMDAFSADQLRRMKLGGNAPFIQFLKTYSPKDKGGYSPEMSVRDKYHCWAAQQYREKAQVDGQPWVPSYPLENSAAPDLAQGLRKSRGRSGVTHDDQTSVEGFSSERGRLIPASLDEKAAKEAYFASLGAANATRSADLPPSQGGRYAGFGNTPETSSTQHTSAGLSSATTSLSEIQADPMAALGKGWSLFSSAVVGASRVVNESVIQPGVEKLTDPNLRDDIVRGVSSSAKNANEWGRAQLGVDVGGLFAGIANTRGSYAAIDPQGDHPEDEHLTSALYPNAGDDDFFKQLNDYAPKNNDAKTSAAVLSQGNRTTTGNEGRAEKTNDWGDDEWKDF